MITDPFGILFGGNLFSPSAINIGEASITALFPTFFYILLLSLAIFLKLILQAIHAPISAMLLWLADLPSHRIGVIMSGLSSLVVLIEAWRAYINIGD